MTSRDLHVRPLAALLAAGALTFALAGCASSTSGSGTPAGDSASSAAATGSSSSSSDSGSSSDAGDAAGSADELASQLADATSQATSVHLETTTDGGAASSTSTSDVKVGDGGKTEALSASSTTSGESFEFVFVDGVGYAKLPSSASSDPSKPWVKLTTSSKNPQVKAIATVLENVQSQSSITQYADLAKVAKDFKATGETEVDGVKAQGYSFTVAAKDLPTAEQFGDIVSQLGDIPVTLAVDGEGRPVETTQKITVQGQTISSTTTLSKWGEDVDISAPDPSQVSEE